MYKRQTINIAIMLLVIVGGIGFLTWDDIYTNKSVSYTHLNNFELSLYLSINICSVDARLLDALATYGYSSRQRTILLFSDNLNTY